MEKRKKREEKRGVEVGDDDDEVRPILTCREDRPYLYPRSNPIFDTSSGPQKNNNHFEVAIIGTIMLASIYSNHRFKAFYT